jgi:hypothetical protein
VDPDWLIPGPDTDPDPAIQVDLDPVPNPDPGFWWPKTEEKKLQLKIFKIFIWSKLEIYLSLELHKGPAASYRRCLQPSKENIQHFKRWNLWTVFYFSG